MKGLIKAKVPRTHESRTAALIKRENSWMDQHGSKWTKAKCVLLQEEPEPGPKLTVRNEGREKGKISPRMLTAGGAGATYWDREEGRQVSRAHRIMSPACQASCGKVTRDPGS